jgi:hypothetical protein
MNGLPIRLDAPAQDAGLGPILADLIRQNVDQRPELRAIFDRLCGGVAVEATDAETSVTMGFAGGALTIRGGIQEPDITIAADSLSLLELANTRLRLGLPDPAHASGRVVLGKLATGKLRIRGRGLLLRPLLLVRFTKLLNVAEG